MRQVGYLQRSYQEARSTKHNIIKRTLEPPQGQKQIRLQVYNTLAFPTLLCGCETWVIKEEDKYRIMSVDKSTWRDYKLNEVILSEHKLKPVVNKIQNYINKWAHVR